MKECIVYHYWNVKSDYPPHLNHRNPLIHSIATLRGVNTSIPIYVLDISDEYIDFHGWDEILNFKRIKWIAAFENYQDKAGWKNLSRIHDIHEFHKTIPEDVIIYSDADVFWLQDPLPLHQPTDRFCFNKYNSGFWYYNKNAETYLKFFEIYNAFIITSLNDDNFRVITRMYTDYNEWYYVLDETVLTYMYVKMPHLFHAITAYEHLAPSCNIKEIDDINNIKMLHLHGTIVENPTEEKENLKKHSRGIGALVIKELHDNMVKSIGLDKVKEIFKKEYEILKNISFYNGDFINKLYNSKIGDMYYLNGIL